MGGGGGANGDPGEANDTNINTSDGHKTSTTDKKPSPAPALQVIVLVSDFPSHPLFTLIRPSSHDDFCPNHHPTPTSAQANSWQPFVFNTSQRHY